MQSTSSVGSDIYKKPTKKKVEHPIIPKFKILIREEGKKKKANKFQTSCGGLGWGWGVPSFHTTCTTKTRCDKRFCEHAQHMNDSSKLKAMPTTFWK